MNTSAAVSTAGPEALIERVQDLQEKLEAAGEGPTRELADELVSAVVQMYGAGLERIMDGLFAAGEAGDRIALGLVDDPVIATLLLIHDLHPVPLADRVQSALDSVRPYMESHGGDVDLLSLQEGVARIRLHGSCSDCSASAVTLELAIKQALEEAAPDLAGLEVEGLEPQLTGVALPMADGNGDAPSGLELPVIMSPPQAAVQAPSWHMLPGAEELAVGTLAEMTVAGRPLLVANVDGTLLAYRDACAACGESLHGAELVSGTLTCPRCHRSFFLPRAGRSMDGERLQLEPVPLLHEQGVAKVALAG
jgi:Fe-S cluster biogenesis protein NfuA/nitrite reductase/ring-hydroxylating ferredoxin subunit